METIRERVVIFRVQEEEYAVPLTSMREIVRYRQISELPDTPDYMEGIINLSGDIIPVIRLSAKFGLTGDRPEDRRIIILKIGMMEIGIVVDEVTEVRRILAASVEPTVNANAEPGACIRGIGRIGNRLIILLDCGRLFSDDELTIFHLVQGEKENRPHALDDFDEGDGPLWESLIGKSH